ncbi:acyl-CoA N-acyltransferase [Serratia phage Parlo]|uniref:Acyl-CoA N-acetyltransferase superfamily protein n=1 Tax=Serratia phage Parlo TaxID=2557554 RepID=A0A482MH29_9CAUD|nr:acyl-CoA N-acyltransferase [Serratia phage Parlo]QBQ72226.1 acyl-CoA N-acetyltransferase superfamily protein [Serratia phage Parlo]HEJ7283140.1 GNAT family N-acetyltransferase [Serratia marcescens]
MGSILYENSGELIAWAAEKIGFEPRDDAKAIGWESSGVLRAVTLWDGFSVCDCNIHIASDGSGHWLSRPYLRASFMHPFVQWNMRRVTGLVPSKNSAALRFDLHLGFEREGIIRHALPDDDIIVLGMLRENCRYIPAKYRS